MRIAFDCSLVPGQQGGVGQYSYQLAHALSRVDKENSYILYLLAPVYRKVAEEKLGLPVGGNFSVLMKRTPVPFQLFKYAGAKECMLGGVEADVFHSNNFCVPRFRDRRKKVIATIYDISVVTHPECHKKANIAHCLAGIKDAVKYADAIISISEHTRDDLIRHFGAPPEKITVTSLAAGPGFRNITDAGVLQMVRNRYNLPVSFVLFIGSLEPRKNIKGLLRAYSCLPERTRKEFPLVIAGGRGWLNSDIPGLVSELGIKDRVHFAGFIKEEDLSAVYSMASLFVYPSLYEGFGLPILEAMACGTPVVTSKTSSMPEVAGDAAVLVEPTDADELVFSMRQLLENGAKRAELAVKGFERAKMFSWEKCARETIAVYRRVAGLNA